MRLARPHVLHGHSQSLSARPSETVPVAGRPFSVSLPPFHGFIVSYQPPKSARMPGTEQHEEDGEKAFWLALSIAGHYREIWIYYTLGCIEFSSESRGANLLFHIRNQQKVPWESFSFYPLQQRPLSAGQRASERSMQRDVRVNAGG